MIPDNVLLIVLIALSLGFICTLLYLIFKRKGCKYCISEENFGNSNNRFRIEPSGNGFVITSEISIRNDKSKKDYVYNESKQIHHCPMCGRFLG